jgi:hypothetical protein
MADVKGEIIPYMSWKLFRDLPWLQIPAYIRPSLHYIDTMHFVDRWCSSKLPQFLIDASEPRCQEGSSDYSRWLTER